MYAELVGYRSVETGRKPSTGLKLKRSYGFGMLQTVETGRKPSTGLKLFLPRWRPLGFVVSRQGENPARD